MNLPLFENPSELKTVENAHDSWEGPLLSDLPEDIISSWWEESGWDFKKFQKVIDRLTHIGTRLVPQEITNKVLKLNGDFTSIFYIGDLKLLNQPIISIVGTRHPSEEGIKRTAKITQDLVRYGYVIMSGLAKGVDSVAHNQTLSFKGKTIAVLGTPFHRVYPKENEPLFNLILEHDGLCLTSALPFQDHGTWLFPKRNKLMAILSQGTIVTEVGPTSGVKHQCAECLRKGRKLFFLKSLAENPELKWVQSFIKSGGKILSGASELKDILK